MLQKGIIETIEDKYTVKVRIPKYDKLESDSTGTKTKDLSVGIVCTLPGMNLTYSVGDIVLVDFENDELSKPVILGLLYREQESSSVLEIDGIDSSIDSINNKLDEISAQNLYTHIKYSNDNGMTFTSLYDPTTIKEGSSAVVGENDFTIIPNTSISVNPSVEYIYWNIIDANNVDITSSIPIKTVLHGTNSVKGIDKTIESYSSLIKMPIEFKPCSNLELTFEISISKKEAENYYICLTTDKNAIGSVYGDYIGISTSNSATPSNNTKDYSWSSVVERSALNTERTTDDLLERIRANERDIRGHDEDDKSIDSGVGLLEAINISLNNILIGLNRNTVYFGNANNYININNSELGINTITQYEYQLTRVSQRSGTEIIPHLVLYYIN